jgi:hypothetical protein
MLIKTTKIGRLVLLGIVVVTLSLVPEKSVSAQTPTHMHTAAPSPTPVRYTRTSATYEPPDVMLVGMDDDRLRLRSVLDHDGPVMLQFIFTTCTTVCPFMSAILSGTQSKLGDDLKQIKTLEQVSLAGVEQIYVSASLVNPDLTTFPSALREKTFLTFPFNLPQSPAPDAFRARAWFRSRGVEKTDERVQLNTYFMLRVVDHAITNLAGNFSRDYFIENVELETGLTSNPGVFPRLSLGPGQRFASKGCYIIRIADGKIEAVSRWIVP